MTVPFYLSLGDCPFLLVPFKFLVTVPFYLSLFTLKTIDIVVYNIMPRVFQFLIFLSVSSLILLGINFFVYKKIILTFKLSSKYIPWVKYSMIIINLILFLGIFSVILLLKREHTKRKHIRRKAAIKALSVDWAKSDLN